MLRDQRCKLRAEAFVTHAAIVHSLGAVYVRPHVAVLLASLREALIRGTRSRLFCPEALASLAALAHSFGEEVALQLQPLIKPILSLPLSPALLQALHALTTSIPSLARSLRASVLNILTYVLSRRTWSELTQSNEDQESDDADEVESVDELYGMPAGPGGAPISYSPSGSPMGSPLTSPGSSPASPQRRGTPRSTLGVSGLGGGSGQGGGGLGGGHMHEQLDAGAKSLKPPLSPIPSPLLRRRAAPAPYGHPAAKVPGPPEGNLWRKQQQLQPRQQFVERRLGQGEEEELIPADALQAAGQRVPPSAIQHSKFLSGKQPQPLSPSASPMPASPLHPPASPQLAASPMGAAQGSRFLRALGGGALPSHLTAHHASTSVDFHGYNAFGARGWPSSAHGPDGSSGGGMPSTWLESNASNPLNDPRQAATLGVLHSPSGNSFATTPAKVATRAASAARGIEHDHTDLASPPIASALEEFASMEDTEIALALSTFALYVPQTDSHAVFTFLQQHISPLLFHPSPPVRLEAALLTTRLLTPGGSPMPTSGVLGSLASRLLSHLLSVCVGDADEAIRICVLEELDWRFLPALADPLLLRPLALALHDASLAVRLAGVALIGSLASHNPAVANPALRKMLLTLLSQLRSSTDSMHGPIAQRAHQEAATLLTAVERHAPHLVRTYCLQIHDSLLPLMLTDAPPHTAAAVTLTLAELLTIAGPLLDPHADKLLARFLDAMKHRGAPGRRRAALAALERLVSCRGPAVIEPTPYERSTALFPTLMSMCATEPDEQTRSSALRVIGLLGAIEPLQYRAAAIKAETRTLKDTTSRDAAASASGKVMVATAPTGPSNRSGIAEPAVVEAAPGPLAKSKRPATASAAANAVAVANATARGGGVLDGPVVADGHAAQPAQADQQTSEDARRQNIASLQWGDDLPPTSPLQDLWQIIQMKIG